MFHVVAEFLLNFSRTDEVRHLLVIIEDLGSSKEVPHNFLPCYICASRQSDVFPPGISVRKLLRKIFSMFISFLFPFQIDNDACILYQNIFLVVNSKVYVPLSVFMNWILDTL